MWGMLQVVGLRNGWQTALVMSGISTKIHAKRLAQATEVVLELRASGDFVRSMTVASSCIHGWASTVVLYWELHQLEVFSVKFMAIADMVLAETFVLK